MVLPQPPHPGAQSQQNLTLGSETHLEVVIPMSTAALLLGMWMAKLSLFVSQSLMERSV